MRVLSHARPGRARYFPLQCLSGSLRSFRPPYIPFGIIICCSSFEYNCPRTLVVVRCGFHVDSIPQSGIGTSTALRSQGSYMGSLLAFRESRLRRTNQTAKIFRGTGDGAPGRLSNEFNEARDYLSNERTVLAYLSHLLSLRGLSKTRSSHYPLGI
ncbi:uncharacterized protein EI90DRAFT_3049745 [Cantharellus anzutake]|uniref:uncharacterized protein n=1 Tax=Cantharellus anzutake TaxID=1750568 RepID=UPI0019083975|nr:uncharacterized protein EI90DRAFT_3049745 [Cantharellus anzutake]KAF8334664.1 hypothetical protein EI90DRAFT_3049745 [Cantharellus anzutake]